MTKVPPKIFKIKKKKGKLTKENVKKKKKIMSTFVSFELYGRVCVCVWAFFFFMQKS